MSMSSKNRDELNGVLELVLTRIRKELENPHGVDSEEVKTYAQAAEALASALRSDL